MIYPNHTEKQANNDSLMIDNFLIPGFEILITISSCADAWPSAVVVPPCTD